MPSHPAGRVGWEPDGRCRIAELLMRDGRVQQATEIWAAHAARTPADTLTRLSVGRWFIKGAPFERGDPARLAPDTDRRCSATVQARRA